VLTHINEEGGSASQVDTAVHTLVEAGTAHAFVRRFASRRDGVLAGDWSARRESRTDTLALEMALHEDTERTALAGELGALRAAWQDAEEIAAIADSLLVSGEVADRLRTLKRPARD
jgi:hypothetical protein